MRSSMSLNAFLSTVGQADSLAGPSYRGGERLVGASRALQRIKLSACAFFLGTTLNACTVVDVQRLCTTRSLLPALLSLLLLLLMANACASRITRHKKGTSFSAAAHTLREHDWYWNHTLPKRHAE